LAYFKYVTPRRDVVTSSNKSQQKEKMNYFAWISVFSYDEQLLPYVPKIGMENIGNFWIACNVWRGWLCSKIYEWTLFTLQIIQFIFNCDDAYRFCNFLFPNEDGNHWTLPTSFMINGNCYFRYCKKCEESGHF
jgi:hypothetical protein